MLYHYHENFVLPLSHDEVVHGKGSLSGRMPGDDWQRFANLRTLLGYQWLFPGKKLLFMGGEFGQSREWNENSQLDWWLLETGPYHVGAQKFVADLNQLYQKSPGLWQADYDHNGFSWIDCNDRDNSVLSFLRQTADGRNQTVVILNLTPVPREAYRVGLPQGGHWKEVLNSNGAPYGGTNSGNGGGVEAQPVPAHARSHSAAFFLPPLSLIVFQAGN
jgi:1,4-alpha-glucan branching enzyme